MDFERWQMLDENNRNVWAATLARLRREQPAGYNNLALTLAEAVRLPHPYGVMVLDAFRGAGAGLFVDALLEGAN